ncbi:MAG: 4a-hydroxytetrahydrobiopterin dehydratase [Saprospiraceae bacterium]|jgi:4a-hydroxytetrahydrobiopterin dehydratase
MTNNTKRIDDWTKENNYLIRTITFENFKEALHAMNLIGEVAEELNHHPNWSNSYNTLEIKLFTHTTDSVTDLDYTLASRINEIISEKFV